MYQKLDSCPLCKGTSFNNKIICQDYLVTKESFAIMSCNTCNFLFTNPRPKDKELDKYYQSSAYISHSNKANSLINFIYKLVRTYTLSEKVKLIDSLNKEKSLLDFGCGTGDFLQNAETHGWRTFGIEPNPDASEEAQKKINGQLLQKISHLPTSVEIITAWHVLEHVPDLLPTVKELTKALKHGGYFIMALPNHNSYDAQHYTETWAAYDVPRHLYHFDKHSVYKLATKAKLQVQDILPMKFDSYYVSLLSEKHAGSNGSLLSAIQTGWKSNRLAKKTGEYSSLIYILKK